MGFKRFKQEMSEERLSEPCLTVKEFHGWEVDILYVKQTQVDAKVVCVNTCMQAYIHTVSIKSLYDLKNIL